MTPELRNLQLEELRDEIERVRTVLVDGYRVRKWLKCKKITEKRLEELIDLIELKDEKRQFYGNLSVEYRADVGRFDMVICKAGVQTAIKCDTWQRRNPTPRSKIRTLRDCKQEAAAMRNDPTP